MGNVVPTGTVGEDPKNLLPLLDPELVYRANLNGVKLLKSVQCQTDIGPLVVKVYWRWNHDIDLKAEEEKLRSLQLLLQDCPNLCTYDRFKIGESKSNSAFLVRPYFFSNLYDRLSTLPFLSIADKIWITYQLLRAVSICHKRGVVHGDIKSENVMVTSWNWVVLADIASYKPAYIPADQPGYFDYFFASQQRSSCCLAPERLRTSDVEHGSEKVIQSMLDPNTSEEWAMSDLDYSANVRYQTTGSKTQDGLNPSMDIFSVGCVIAELFTDGHAGLNYSELLRLSIQKKVTPHITAMLEKIPQPKVREMVGHMIQYNARSRLTAEEYLRIYTGDDAIFPTWMENSFYDFMQEQVKPMYSTPDARIWQTSLRFADLVKELAPGKSYSENIELKRSNIIRVKHAIQFFEENSPSTELHEQTSKVENDKSTATSQENGPDASSNVETSKPDFFEEELELLTQATQQFASNLAKAADQAKELEASLSGEHEIDAQQLRTRAQQLMQYSNLAKSSSTTTSQQKADTSSELSSDDELLSDNDENNVLEDVDKTSLQNVHREGLVLLIPLLTANIRAATLRETKLVGLFLLRKLSSWCNDDQVRLGRVVPYIVSLVGDAAPLVRSWSLRILLEVLDQVQDLPLGDAAIIPEYILPALSKFPSDESHLAQLTFAQCIPKLAEISRRFLDLARLKLQNRTVQEANGSELKDQQELVIVGSYDAQLERLHSDFENIIQRLISRLTGVSSLLKQTLLRDITRLCVFFGRERTDDYVLPILITFLNERNDWQLRAAFFEQISGVSAYVGQDALEQFLLPCIEQGLHDQQELVAESAIRCLVGIVQLQLLSRHSTIDLIPKTCPLLVHPSRWIRAAAVMLCTAFSCSHQFSVVDVQVMLVPHLEPLLRKGGNGKLNSERYLIGRTKNFDENMKLIQSLITEPVSRQQFEAAALASRTSSKDAEREEYQGDGEVTIKLELLRPYFQSAKGLPGSKSKPEKQTMKRHKLPPSILQGIAYPHQDFATLKATAGSVPTQSKSSVMQQYGIRPVTRMQGADGKPDNIGTEAFDGSVATLQKRIKALGIPPLLMDVGALINQNGKPYSIADTNKQWTGQSASTSKAPDNNSQRRGSTTRAQIGENGTQQVPQQWRPDGVLAATLHQHSAAVNRIVVSQDHIFFASGSDDGSVCLWLSAKLDSTISVQPKLKYASQGGRIVDLCMIHNSHSIASASTSGSVHVFKVEHAHGSSEFVASNDSNGGGKIPDMVLRDNTGNASRRSLGVSTVLEVDYSKDGAICAIAHFNSASESLLVAATSGGTIRAWDLRTNQEVWTIRCGPQSGLVTALAVAPCGLWMAVGTSRGVIMIWDIRYQVLVKAWWHSSRSIIHRISATVSHDKPFLLIAAGSSQAALWDIDTGRCMRLFKILKKFPAEKDRNVHFLEPIEPVSSLGPKSGWGSDATTSWGKGPPAFLTQRHGLWDKLGVDQLAVQPNGGNSIRAMLCPSQVISPYSTQNDSRITSLLTAGTDKCVRFWDTSNHTNGSYVVSGTPLGETNEVGTVQEIVPHSIIAPPGAVAESSGSSANHKVTVLLRHPIAPPAVLSQLNSPSNPNPMMSGRGPVPPHSQHQDCILDLQLLDLPPSTGSQSTRMLLSASRDGVIKAWR